MRGDIFTRMACARRSRLLATEFYLTSTGCSNPLWYADRIWLRSVEWEATRVGDVIGARLWRKVMVAREGQSFGLRFCIPSRLEQTRAPTSDRARHRAL